MPCWTPAGRDDEYDDGGDEYEGWTPEAHACSYEAGL
jgi:hypothetical protein